MGIIDPKLTPERTSTMNDHNLDDLIIDTPDHQNGGKAKGILTIIALLIIIMIAAIVLTKIILKDPDAQPAVLEETDMEMISPELTLQHVTMGTDESPEAVAPKTTTIEETSVVQEDTSAPQEESPLSTPQTAPVSTPASTKPPKPEHTTPPHTKPKEVVKIPTSVTSAHTAKPKPQQTHKKPIKSTATTTSRPKPIAASHEQFYIQVGSFSKAPEPNSQLVTAIRKQGFKHRIFTINGMKKLVIGPYPSRAAADRAIVRVKALINKSAFVIKR